MDRGVFYWIGKGIYHARWLVIFFWLIVILSALPLLPKILEPFKAIGFIDKQSESAKANELINHKLGYGYNRYIAMYSSNTLLASQSEFNAEIRHSLAGLKQLSLPHKIIYPTDANKQISADKHHSYAVILFKGGAEADEKLLKELKASIKQPPHLILKMGGEPIFLDDTKHQTEKDLYRAEYIGTPAAIITMLVVFGSVVAAVIPVILGGFTALLTLIALYFLGQFFTLSVFTINIALLLGLCLSLDYALLMVNRFREELAKGNPPGEALAIMQATAGKSVFLSGMAVFCSLSALLLFHINILYSVGIGGLAAISVSMLMALTLLPAVLSVLKQNINRLAIRKINTKVQRVSYWYWFVTKVVNAPYLCFIIILSILLALGYPFLHAKFGISDFRILPPNLESRQVFDSFKTRFGESKLAPILIVVTTPHEKILNQHDLNFLYDYVNRIKKDPRVDQVISIVNTTPALTKKQYDLLYTHSNKMTNPGLKELLETTTNENLSLITVVSKYESNSTLTQDLITSIRGSHPGDKLKIAVTGTSANTLDVLNSIYKVFIYAFLWIIGFTYLILLFSLRSIILPLKAIITTILSLTASYGVLVLVIQEGYLHHLLHFEPQGMLDISLLIIIFCALFGVSMDYEVFLLTRIKEFYEETGKTKESIVAGIVRSNKIITSAAIIVILICFSFMSAEILMVKAFGLGIAVAVFVDAFLIRTILVPAAMTILGKWNWYLPKWLDKILPKISYKQAEHPQDK